MVIQRSLRFPNLQQHQVRSLNAITSSLLVDKILQTPILILVNILRKRNEDFFDLDTVVFMSEVYPWQMDIFERERDSCEYTPDLIYRVLGTVYTKESRSVALYLWVPVCVAQISHSSLLDLERDTTPRFPTSR